MGPNIFPCWECKRDIDASNLVSALSKHNVIIGIKIAVSILTKKPLTRDEANLLGLRAGKHIVEDPLLPFHHDNSVCPICLQKYSICWNCRRYVNEARYLNTLKSYEQIMKGYNPKFTLGNGRVDSVTYKITTRNDVTIEWATNVKQTIRILEQGKAVRPVDYNCYVCLQ